VVDWFDHWLEGADNSVMKKPGSVVSMSPTDHWWQSTWPARGASPVALHPHEGGRTAGALRLARATSGRERVTDDASFSVEELADKSRSAHRLLYRTPPLSQRLTLSGLASVRLEVSFDAPASNLSVALVDLGPKGGTTVLSEGWADPQNIDSLHEGTALEPRTRYAIEVDLDQVLQHRLPSGHRLALVVAASDRSSPSARRRGRTSGSPSPRRRSTSRCSEAPTPCATRCGHE